MQVIVKATATSGSSSSAGSGTSSGTTSGNGTITNAGPDQTLTLPTNTTTLNGAASYDPEGVFRAWKWMKISGPDQHTIANASNSVTTVSNLVEGTYRFSLTGWGNNWSAVQRYHADHRSVFIFTDCYYHQNCYHFFRCNSSRSESWYYGRQIAGVS